VEDSFERLLLSRGVSISEEWRRADGGGELLVPFLKLFGSTHLTRLVEVIEPAVHPEVGGLGINGGTGLLAEKTEGCEIFVAQVCGNFLKALRAS